MIYHHSTTKGFSLVEVLVAVSLLLLVSVGPMQILHQTSNSTTYANEQVVAYFLAQEGVELVHKHRDNLLLEYFKGEFGLGNNTTNSPMGDMLSGTLDDCDTGTGCGLHIENDGILTSYNCGLANGVDRCQLYLHTSNRARYSHDSAGGEPTPYVRRIQIEETTSNGQPLEFKVTSTVEWRTGSLIGGQRVQLVTYLQNVYDTQ